MQYLIRQMADADLANVSQLQDSCYADNLYEAPQLLQQRLASHPHSCWLAENTNKQLLAYLFSYPSRSGQVMPLGSLFNQYADADVLYLHDMAVSDRARGAGLAGRLLRQAEAYAAELGLSRLALVAVQGSMPYWHKQGFAVVADITPQQQLALHSYIGQQAVYMQKSL